jgi:hypothetical protein
MAVGSLQVRNILEPHKMYSKDYFNVGRLKVELVNDQNQALRKDLPNSNIDINLEKQLMIKVA